MSLLQELKYNLGTIYSDCEDIEIANHSQYGEEFVTISEMSKPKIARNNCWIVSNEIMEQLDLSEYATIDEVDMVGAAGSLCSHYAVYLSRGTEQVVLDFTARQFDSEAPFPYVVPLDVWYGYVKHVTGRPDLVLSIGE